MKFNGRGVYVSPTAKIHPSVRIGDHSTIYDNVEIGENSVICNDVILGEPTGSYYHDPAYENSPTIIGPDSFIRSHSIIYAGCTIGRRSRADIESRFEKTHSSGIIVRLVP